ncbi:tetratricopeptide repeat protein [Flavobacterium amniphilum]|uniref:tetratricopeptide repeat protein n=1 Tax=Flavobacterium amniphilum TaxID=1834035 RepID=UPI00202A501D|nr:tetratricopeptide repeat protein [Flavobacterium amniphilum]MCL9806511.1 tetratricopeptide repeat protein [Flavobacterium amniphilum]
MKYLIFLLVPFVFYAQNEGKNDAQNAIIKEYLDDCAHRYNYIIQMKEWQNCIDEGLKKDSTIAYLWQQKAMPYFKARKYEAGMPYIDKAVRYNAERWQPYRAFIKCIFAKTYKEAIADFEDCKKKYGNGYVMDHTYDFYMALSYLQLNEYQLAEKLLQNYVDDMLAKNGEEWVHFTALFYLGISKYEQNKLEEAIAEFDRALKKYPNYSEVKTYKGICLYKLGKKEASEKIMKEAESDYKQGYKMTEDNAVYETYPYQLRRK